MKSLLLSSLLTTAALGPAAPPPTALAFPGEEKLWETIAARFASPSEIMNDQAKTYELAVSGLVNDPKHGGSASVLVDKATGHAVEIIANGAAFSDDEVAGFSALPELRALTLWHNSGGFTGATLARLAALPRLERLTLAGGGLDDTGLAAAAKIPTLRELRAWHARFSDAGIAALRGHPALESIAIGPMWEPLLTDKTLESLADCPQLKKLSLTETWLTWQNGLRHLARRKETLQQLELGDCLIDPADVERLRQALPQTKIVWVPPGTGREELSKPWLRSRAEQWIPKAVLDQAPPVGK